MEEALKQEIISAIQRSGFPLEHQVGNILREHGWQTISNRYYIDDIKGTEREIDIVAYKLFLDKTEQIEYITTLIISCKKNEKNKWCFLTRNTDPTDANFNWSPLHYCTTDERLDYMTKRHKGVLIRQYKSEKDVRDLYDFSENVFAYQKIRDAKDKSEKEKGMFVLNGNTDIYESIITTIKALNFEKSSRIKRYEKYRYKRYYTFHLLSVFGGEMVKDHFEEDGTQVIQNIDEIKYLNRHIINNEEDFYVVNFIQIDNFENRLNLFDDIHKVNTEILPKFIDTFYKDIFKYRDRVMLFWDECSRELGEVIQTYADSDTHPIQTSDPLPRLFFVYDDKLIICIYDKSYKDDKLITELNDNEGLKEEVNEILQRYYRYSGPFSIINWFSQFE